MKHLILLASFFVLSSVCCQTDSLREELTVPEKSHSENIPTVLKIFMSQFAGEIDPLLNSGFAYEFEFGKTFSYCGALGFLSQQPIGKENYQLRGLSLTQQLRLYFFKCRFYIGLQTGINRFYQCKRRSQ